MTTNIYQDIKDRVDLRELVRYYGLDVNRGGFACCPFHNERTPSFKVYEDHFHCFGCCAHGDHIDFVQKMYGETKIEAAKRISSDFGLKLFEREPATPFKPRLKQKNELNMWLFKSIKIINEYIDILEKWEKLYSPRSPVDNVDERYLESLHNKGYAEMFLESLKHGDDDEKRELYYEQRDYVRKIKERLDKLDAVSRKPHIKAV